MRTCRATISVFVTCFLVLFSCSAAQSAQVTTGVPSSALLVDYRAEIRPLFEEHCYRCHGSEKQKGDLRLDMREHALKGGESGVAIVPGNATQSLLIQLVSGQVDDKVMPPKGARLTPRQIETLRAWIDQGASWPEDDKNSKVQEPVHWSLKPLARPALPEVKDKTWARTPIDSFILAKLEENEMRPSEPADRRTLLRRVYFDLIGLPPAPAELDAFVSNKAPNAWEEVIDRLLNSPRYGERWARHWLDVAHYAETHGHDQDRPRTNSWPYRDYVIGVFNSDKPYSRFVEEQIAGDILYPDDPQATVAMGFLATGPWDESSLRDIREDTIDRQIARYLDRDDIVATTMNTFVSTTVQCARCHNHKFDPISQEEYYGLQAVFAATDKGNRLYDPDPVVHKHRKELTRRKEALARQDPQLLAELSRVDFQKQVTAWESSLSNSVVSWAALKPTTCTSSNGTTLTILEDGSVLASGSRPETDTYTVIAPSQMRSVTGIRLEVLTDPSLPKNGPGRQDNGNLHLTNLRLLFADEGSTNTPQTCALQHPSADFNQQDWDIAKAIDDDTKTAWGIYPEVGKPHQAVFELKEPPQGRGQWTFVLEQNHGGGHLIGKFRLSVTTNTPPVGLNRIPDAIAGVLALPPEKRSKEQRSDLTIYVATLQIEQELARLPEPQLVYAGASDFVPDGGFKPAGKPREVHLLKRGDINQPGAISKPGALHCLAQLSPDFDLKHPEDEGARRAALAHWITDRRNALAWRSIVNRLWHYHFGRGIVATPNDFGKMGAAPSHSELLDWLATWFQDNGGSIKKLHKLILMSAVYQQSSKDNPAFAERDAENTLLWRMNRSRLDAESVRDTILAVSGKIDFKMGGPSVQQFVMSPGIHVTPVVDYNRFDVDSKESCRRSIYRFIFRTLPDPFMDSLDCPDASQAAPVRNTSVTVLQALSMLNDRFVVRQSEHFAERLEHLAPGNQRGQIEAGYRWALGREPRPDELADLAAFAGKNGLPNFCRVLFNSNEFMFIP